MVEMMIPMGEDDNCDGGEVMVKRVGGQAGAD